MTAESAHRITISLDGLKPLIVTLPHPILPSSFKTISHPKDGVVEITATKALNYLWPTPASRWDVETFDEWKDEKALKILPGMVDENSQAGGKDFSQVRNLFRQIFIAAMRPSGQLLFQVRIKGRAFNNFYIRAHPPVRISPEGDPILPLSVMDPKLTEKDGKLDSSRDADDFLAAFGSSRDSTDVAPVFFDRVEGVGILRFILRQYSKEIQPTAWQMENLPSIGDIFSPWLATFIVPIHTSDEFLKEPGESTPLSKQQHGRCWNCSKSSKENLKRCSRCKAVSYCSVECQRADWSAHKSSCFAP